VLFLDQTQSYLCIAVAAAAVGDDDEDHGCLAAVAMYIVETDMLLTWTCVTQANKRR